MRYSHMAITVRDMEETLRFYRDALGFDRIFGLDNPDTGKPWIVYIKILPGQFLELFYGGDDNVKHEADQTGFSHLCFEVEDVHAIARRIEEAGYTLDIRPCQGCDHNWQTWVRDPNGIRIELMSISKESPHYQFM